MSLPILDQKPTLDRMESLWGVCVAWIEQYKPLCPESIYQTDRCSIGSMELAENVCDIVGYIAIPEEEER